VRSQATKRGSYRGEPNPLVAWRAERLRVAGFDDALARSVAGDCGFDIHALLELVDRGCPPQLAARIVSPLEDEHRPCPAPRGC
jgi:hypothetical protein